MSIRKNNKLNKKEITMIKFKDFIFNNELETQLNHLLNNPKKIPPVLCFYGEFGNGKTSFAKFLANEVGSDTTYIEVNNCDNNKIPEHLKKTLLERNMFHTKYYNRVIILDEMGDATTKLKKSLKTILDKHSENEEYLFILCLNSDEKSLKKIITPPIFSRVHEISFNTKKTDMPELTERVKYKFPMLSIDVIKNKMPDY